LLLDVLLLVLVLRRLLPSVLLLARRLVLSQLLGPLLAEGVHASSTPMPLRSLSSTSSAAAAGTAAAGGCCCCCCCAPLPVLPLLVAVDLLLLLLPQNSGSFASMFSRTDSSCSAGSAHT
jgi:hypothetical protein